MIYEFTIFPRIFRFENLASLEVFVPGCSLEFQRWQLTHTPPRPTPLVFFQMIPPIGPAMLQKSGPSELRCYRDTKSSARKRMAIISLKPKPSKWKGTSSEPNLQIWLQDVSHRGWFGKILWKLRDRFPNINWFCSDFWRFNSIMAWWWCFFTTFGLIVTNKPDQSMWNFTKNMTSKRNYQKQSLPSRRRMGDVWVLFARRTIRLKRIDASAWMIGNLRAKSSRF